VSRHSRIAVGVALVVAAAAIAGVAYAAYAATTSNPTSTITAAPDWTAPTASASVIGRSAGCAPTTPGYLKQGSSYYVYANVSDTGNPASGVSTVTANVSSLSAGQTALALASGSFPIGGTTYGRRSAAVAADAVLTAGSKTYSLTSTDVAGNNGTQSGFSATVDNTAPTASDIHATNKAAGTAGRPEAGDLVTYTFSEQMEACSLLANWDGSSTTVTLRITNNSLNDTVTVWNSANTSQLAFGSVALGTNSVTASATFTSTMIRSGSTVTVTLGSQTSGTANTTASGTASIWTPSTSAYDRAQNAMAATTASESGSADPNF
jgi:hypothetical protein